MNNLRQFGSSDERFEYVKYKVLNPKSINMGELYGEVDPHTDDWIDGLASKILRKFTKVESKRKSWCVFDGPADTLWIENMNSVLDDNMMLSLMNGERINLNEQIRILFEVQDLASASLATVSRCGMVYVTPQDLSWKVIYDSWLRKAIRKKNILSPKQQAYMSQLFEEHIDQLTQKLEKFVNHQVMPTMHL